MDTRRPVDDRGICPHCQNKDPFKEESEERLAILFLCLLGALVFILGVVIGRSL